MSDTASNVPIGTVVPYAGEIDAGWLEQQGWLYCNGASLKKRDYRDLSDALNNAFGGNRTNFNLPDLRGRFVRGVDGNTKRDPAVATRQQSNSGGLSGDNPGSVEAALTAKPTRPFVAAEAGGHHHPVPHAPVDNNAYAVAGSHYGLWTNDATTTGEAGQHTHQLGHGGDHETRPANNYVFFVIKFADA